MEVRIDFECIRTPAPGTISFQLCYQSICPVFVAPLVSQEYVLDTSTSAFRPRNQVVKCGILRGLTKLCPYLHLQATDMTEPVLLLEQLETIFPALFGAEAC